jgi:dTDP-4-dehydrorhamnose 3,5-epimerase
MGAVILDDIVVTHLKRIPTEGGDVMHGIKSLDPGFVGFGEAYFSWVKQGAVKAWKQHTRMTMNVIVPVGTVRFVFCIDGGCRYRVEDIGEERYVRLSVPPGLWFGFQGLSAPQSLVLNVASIEHDPTEVNRLEKNSIDYNWN